VSGFVTALFGCGQIGAGYAADPRMAEHYRYASHTQVLAEHPAYDWVAAVDPAESHAQACAEQFGVVASGDVAGLSDREAIEVAVLATPPGTRRALIEALPNLKAVLVEKPLGADLAEAREFAALCKARGLVVQVNLPRRADVRHRDLAEGGLARAIGDVQGAFMIYGNGLHNNGTHMVDLARMLLGEVADVSVPAGATSHAGSPLDGDGNMPFSLVMQSGVTVMALPVGFDHYRENALDLWGTDGRLSLVSEGLRLCRFERRENRTTTGAFEIASDDPVVETTSMGEALYAVHDDLAHALQSGTTPVSPLDSALETSAVIEAIHEQALAVAA
jgi:predicted dehydrogenase